MPPAVGTSRTGLSLKRIKSPALKLKSFAQAFSRLRRARRALSFLWKKTGRPRRNVKVSSTFSKVAGWRGGALPRPSQWAKSSRFPQAQEGRSNRPVDGLTVGNPSEGFPTVSRLVQFAKSHCLFRQAVVILSITEISSFRAAAIRKELRQPLRL